jgi:hypothetical protein
VLVWAPLWGSGSAECRRCTQTLVPAQTQRRRLSTWGLNSYGFVERVLQILMPLRVPQSQPDVAFRLDGEVGWDQPARDELDELARCSVDAELKTNTEFSLCC